MLGTIYGIVNSCVFLQSNKKTGLSNKRKEKSPGEDYSEDKVYKQCGF